MMDKEERFFSGIGDSLHAYEDAYKPGAWEAFNQQRKRKRMALWFYRAAGAAAVLLLFSYVAVQFFATDNKPVQFTKTKVATHQPGKVQPQGPAVDSAILGTQPQNSPLQTDIAANPSVKGDNLNNMASNPAMNGIKAPTYQQQTIPTTTQRQPVPDPIFTNPDSRVIAANPNMTAPADNSQAIKKPVFMDSAIVKALPDVSVGAVMAQNQPKKTAPVTRSIYDSLVNSKNTTPALANLAKKDDRNLTYSVVVAPGMGNQKVNFGTGVEVAYKLSDNFSISSGVAYSSLNAATNGSNSPTASASRQVQGINLAVSGVEVPIGVQYKTNSGYYVSAGVVGMQVLSNNIQYNYLAQVTVPQATYSAVAGKDVEALRATTEAKTEDSREKIKNVLGFYMLSVGKKKAVGNNQLNFGPFIRIPFGAVSSENIRLLQGGVRLGFDF